MSDDLSRHDVRELQFEHGRGIGISNRWHGGQYCSILTPAGIVGCGIYDLEVAGEFGQAMRLPKEHPRIRWSSRKICSRRTLWEPRRKPSCSAFGRE